LLLSLLLLSLNNLEKLSASTPNKGMIFLPDTLKIEKGGVEITDGYTLEANTEDGITGYQKGFIITFATRRKTGYKITTKNSYQKTT
jgi:hypothetical protein